MSNFEVSRQFENARREIIPIIFKRAITEKDAMAAYNALWDSQRVQLSEYETMREEFLRFIDHLVDEVHRENKMVGAKQDNTMETDKTQLSQRKQVEIIAFLKQLRQDAEAREHQIFNATGAGNIDGVVVEANEDVLDISSAPTLIPEDQTTAKEKVRRISGQVAPYIFGRAVSNKDIITAHDQLAVLKYSAPNQYADFRNVLIDLIQHELKKIDDGLEAEHGYNREQLKHFLESIEQESRDVIA